MSKHIKCTSRHVMAILGIKLCTRRKVLISPDPAAILQDGRQNSIRCADFI